MSLILEALKKSEAERQLGRAPGLMSPMVRVSKRRGVSPWWGILGLAVLIVAGAAWYVNRETSVVARSGVESRDAQTPTDAAATQQDSATRADAATTQRVATSPAAAQTTPRQSLGERQSTPGASSAPDLAIESPPDTPMDNATTAPLPVDPDFASIERESLPMQPPVASPPTITTLPVDAKPTRPTAPTLSAPSARVPEPLPPVATPAPVAERPPPVAASDASIPSAAVAERDASIPSAPVAAVEPPVTAPPPTLPATLPPIGIDAAPPEQTSAAPASTDAPLEALPTVADLMPDVRGALPALKLSMHVFAADPAGRFVLIDGKRYAQGERIADSLTVAEIRRDGAVLDFRGKRFVVPRP